MSGNALPVRPIRRVQWMRAVQSCLVALLCAVGLLGGAAFGPDAEALIYPSCLAFVALAVWSVWSWRSVTGSLFDPYVLFLVAAVLFNGGHALLELGGWNDSGSVFDRFSSETALQTVFLVSLGLAAFHLGALFGIPGKASVKRSTSGTDLAALRTVRTVGWALLLVSSVPALLSLRDAVLVVMTSGYFALYQREVATSVAAIPTILAAFLVPGGLFLLAGARESRTARYASGVVVLIYAVVQLFLGHRSPAAMPLVAYAWLWHRSVRRLRGAVLAAIGAPLLFVVFPLLADVRDVSGADRLSAEFLADAFFSIDNPVIAIVSEMGGSMHTVAHTLELVPGSRDFDMGVGYLYGLLTVLPSVFWDVHPTVDRGLAESWLVWIVEPAFAAAGGSLGFSFMAEAYLGFGWYGAPVVLGALGFFLARLTLWALSSEEPAKSAMVASLLSFFLFLARSEVAAQIRLVVWYALLPYLAVLAIAAWRRRRGGWSREALRTGPDTAHGHGAVRCV